MRKLYISCFVLSGFILGCEKEIDMDIPNNGSNIVVNGMLSPDSTFKVNVSGSLHILDNGQPQYLDNAAVSIQDASGNTEALSLVEDGWYESAISPVEGANYTISVSAGNYTSVSGQTTIPQSVPISSWDTVPGVSFEESATVEVTISFDDPASEQNYYHVYLEKVIDDGFGGAWVEPIGFYTRDAQIDQGGEAGKWYNDLTLKDELFNGQSYDLVLYIDEYYFEEGFGSNDFIKMHLISASSDYYNYVRTYNSYLWSNGDPFSQPVIIYSNIDGGHGVFGGYSVATDTINL